MSVICGPPATEPIPTHQLHFGTHSKSQNEELHLSVRWTRDVDELESLVVDWNSLAKRALRKNPAFEPNYLIPALKHFGDSATRVLLVEGRHRPFRMAAK